MLEYSREMYEMRFKIKVYEGTGNAYQDLFSLIMELCHPSDFMSIRPWGNVGDKKNDGYLRSERHLYQVYAPNEMEAKAAIKKINDDFEGALPHWEQYFDKWSFVHNSYGGVPPHVLETLHALEENNLTITIGHLGPVQLRTKLFDLREEDIAYVLGPPMARPQHIAFEEISQVLDNLNIAAPEPTTSVLEVPIGKLDANGFDDNSKALVRLGFRLSPRVTAFFDSYQSDPELGMRVSALLRYEYSRLKRAGNDPNAIYRKLFAFVNRHQESSEAASLAVLAYFFESCDIFEAPPQSIFV
jgi:hypothetical protein